MSKCKKLAGIVESHDNGRALVGHKKRALRDLARLEFERRWRQQHESEKGASILSERPNGREEPAGEYTTDLGLPTPIKRIDRSALPEKQILSVASQIKAIGEIVNCVSEASALSRKKTAIAIAGVVMAYDQGETVDGHDERITKLAGRWKFEQDYLAGKFDPYLVPEEAVAS